MSMIYLPTKAALFSSWLSELPTVEPFQFPGPLNHEHLTDLNVGSTLSC